MGHHLIGDVPAKLGIVKPGMEVEMKTEKAVLT
jgi:hypothetical protein